MIPVWDLFVRLYHWALVAIVVLNLAVTESGGDWHERLGYLAAALIGARIVWGFVSPSPFARFRSFWPTRARVRDYWAAWRAGHPPRFLTHNPLAAIAMLTLLSLLLLLALTGWMMSWDLFFGEEWLEVVHEWLGWGLAALAAFHATAAVVEGRRHRENLVASMIHGRKREKD